MPIRPLENDSPQCRKQRAELLEAERALRDQIERVAAPGERRGMDLLSAFWSFLDLTPEGRGEFMPKRSYAG